MKTAVRQGGAVLRSKQTDVAGNSLAASAGRDDRNDPFSVQNRVFCYLE